MSTAVNPIIPLDYPDPDVIRVGDTYYMATTTMHFHPCCEILRSYDLINWEHASFVSETLDGTSEQRLEKGDIYGKGMWAASLRFHDGKFYIAYVCNDTRKTYLYISDDINGKWEKQEIEGFYHDCSLLFDDDGRTYIVYGNKEIHLTELNDDLTAPKKCGVDRIILVDEGNNMLGYEGSHFYKINGKYYVFFIHSRKDRWMRCEACFMSDSIEGEFRGGDILEDTLDYCGQGVAQGGIVDTPDSRWYAILFQDRGAAGRFPVLVPMTFENDFPVLGINGKAPESFYIPCKDTGYQYAPLTSSDDFSGDKMLPCWQFNHQPDNAHYSYGGGVLKITTADIRNSVTEAKNVLTQRMTFPRCEVSVTLDARGMKEGDNAGLCAFQGCWAWISVKVEKDGRYIVMQSRKDDGSISESRVPFTENTVTLCISADFENMKDEARLYYLENGEKKQLGETHKLFFKLDHFTGCRAALFIYSEKTAGGYAEFSDFKMN